MKRKTVQADWYDHPLYYDIIFDEDTQKECEFIEQLALKHEVISRPDIPLQILEPACGSGRLVKALCERGHQVSGFDLNDKMLAFATQRLQEADLTSAAQLWVDRMEDFSVAENKLFDVAHCLVSTFKYVLEEEGAISHLQHVAKHLKPGGLYLLGFHLSNYQNHGEEHERWTGSRDGIHVVCNTHTWPPHAKSRREKLRTRLRITREEATWTQETHWEFRTYNRAQAKELLSQVPEFECLECFPFTYELESAFPISQAHYDTVFVLRKKADI